MGKTSKTLAEDLVALHDVDKGVRVDVVEDRAQLDHVGTVEGDVEHLALGALVQSAASDERAATLDVVDDVIADGIGCVGDDKHRLVGLHAIDDKVNDLALDKDDDDRVDGKAYVTKGHEGAQGDDTVNDHDEGTERYLGIFVDNHRDDVRASAGSSRAENHADGHTIDNTGHNRVQEIVGVEPASVMWNLDHRLDHRGIDGFYNITVVDDRVVAPSALKHKSEYENQRCRNNRLDAELGSQHPSADDEQGNVHADGVERNLPRPKGIEHVREAVGASRGHQIGVNKHHIANSEQQTADDEQDIGQQFLPQFSFGINFNHISSLEFGCKITQNLGESAYYFVYSAEII